MQNTKNESHYFYLITCGMYFIHFDTGQFLYECVTSCSAFSSIHNEMGTASFNDPPWVSFS